MLQLFPLLTSSTYARLQIPKLSVNSTQQLIACNRINKACINRKTYKEKTVPQKEKKKLCFTENYNILNRPKNKLFKQNNQSN